MKTYAATALLIACLLSAGCCRKCETPPPPATPRPAPAAASALGFTVDSIDGQPVDLNQYRGKVVLIVNVASRCGHTPQYAGLESLYQTYKDRGLVVLGFPCNQFGQQEPASNEAIKTFCTTNYNVTFDLFAKIDVNGDAASPLYQYLTGPGSPEGQDGPIQWNFEKFLIGRDGRVVARFAPGVQPDDASLVSAIESSLEHRYD